MFTPVWQLRIDQFIEDGNIICLGSQLRQLVEFIEKEIGPLVWYASDVEAFSDVPAKYGVNTKELKLLGVGGSNIELFSFKEQFLSGVFFGGYSETKLEGVVKVHTEDDEFRSIPVNGIAIEIRAFDTTYFELYAEDRNLLDKLRKELNIQAVCSRCFQDR